MSEAGDVKTAMATATTQEATNALSGPAGILPKTEVPDNTEESSAKEKTGKVRSQLFIDRTKHLLPCKASIQHLPSFPTVGCSSLGF